MEKSGTTMPMPHTTARPQQEAEEYSLSFDYTNSTGKVVINDGLLLQLIYKYPFLYDATVLPTKDADYEEWAWDNITKNFNDDYKRKHVKYSYSVQQLQHRWRVLRNVARNPMAKPVFPAEDLAKIFGLIRAKAADYDKPRETPELTPIELLFLDNIPMVERLPPEDLSELEREMMDLILSEELQGDGHRQLTESDLQEIESEFNSTMEFLGLSKISADLETNGETAHSSRNVPPEEGRSSATIPNDTMTSSPTQPHSSTSLPKTFESMVPLEKDESNETNQIQTEIINPPEIPEPELMDTTEDIPLEQVLIEQAPNTTAKKNTNIVEEAPQPATPSTKPRTPSPPPKNYEWPVPMLEPKIEPAPDPEVLLEPIPASPGGSSRSSEEEPLIKLIKRPKYDFSNKEDKPKLPIRKCVVRVKRLTPEEISKATTKRTERYPKRPRRSSRYCPRF